MTKDDQRTWRESSKGVFKRPLGGTEEFFNNVQKQIGDGVCDVYGAAVIRLDEAKDRLDISDNVLKAWIKVRRHHPGTCVYPDHTNSFIFHQDDVLKKANETCRTITLEKDEDEFNSSFICEYIEQCSASRPTTKPACELTVLLPRNTTANKVILLLRMDHIISDAGTVAIILNDLNNFMYATAENDDESVPELPPLSADQVISSKYDEAIENVMVTKEEIMQSQKLPTMPEIEMIEPIGKTGHLIHTLTEEQSDKLHSAAHQLGVSVTALLHAIVILRFGARFIKDEHKNNECVWFDSYPVDTRPALIQQRWSGTALVPRFVCMQNYDQALRSFRNGQRGIGISVLAQEAMKEYKKASSKSFRAALAKNSREIMKSRQDFVQSGEYAFSKQLCHFYSDSRLDDRYISQKGIQQQVKTEISSYQTLLDMNVLPSLFFRGYALASRTTISLDWAKAFWKDDVIRQLFQDVTQDVISYLNNAE